MEGAPRARPPLRARGATLGRTASLQDVGERLPDQCEPCTVDVAGPHGIRITVTESRGRQGGAQKGAQSFLIAREPERTSGDASALIFPCAVIAV